METALLSPLIAAQGGDKRCMKDLLDRFEPLIKSTAWKYTRATAYADIEDSVSIFKLAFIEIVNAMNLEKMRGTSDGELVAYLQTAMKNALCRQLRNDRQEVARTDFSDLSESDMADVDFKTCTRDEYPALLDYEVKSALTAREYSVVNLLVHQDLQVNQVAETLHISRQAVTNIRHRAYDKLKYLS